MELTGKQLKQRQDAAKKSTGPRTQKGKSVSSRNAYKHGLYAKNVLQHGAFKQCQTTCPKFATCEHISKGETKAGGRCVDRAQLVHAFDAIIAAMQDDSCNDLMGLAAAEIASNLMVVQSLRDDIAARGAVLFRPAIDKDGNIIKDGDGNAVGDVTIHPGVTALPKLLDQLGLSLPQFLATPQARAKVEQKDEELETAATIVATMASKFGGIVKRPNPIDAEVIRDDA